VFGNSALGRD